MAEDILVDHTQTFSSFSHILDARILRALAEQGFARPTLVQVKAIPLALEGRDILARARTGSGKTAAYCIPIVQKILNVKSGISPADLSKQVTRAIILVPTRELAEQVSIYLKALLKYCEGITSVNAAAGATTHLQRMILSDKPDIVVATPARALIMLQSKALNLSSLDSLVIDEADLILSYGHDEDMRSVLSAENAYLPAIFQSFLMSATMTKDVEALKGLVLRNPAVLRLEEDEDEARNLVQYAVRCNETDKFLLVYVMLKLKLIKGKCILFVNEVDRCYRLKLFLEQFSIKSCVLNSELPLNSRFHIVQEFNRGIYDYIIATDESGGKVEVDSGDDKDEEMDLIAVPEEQFAATQRTPEPPDCEVGLAVPPTSRKRKRESGPTPKTEPASTQKRKKRAAGARDREYGVSRGIDFVDVACVINFDLPPSARSYTHRVGRTARAGRSGIALSLTVPKEEHGKNRVLSLPGAVRDEKVFARIEREQAARGSKIQEWKFEKGQVDGFRYRMEDGLRAVTASAIKEARIKELKQEILASNKLKAHFEDHPMDLEYLRHDKPLHPARVQPHMKYVPRYLLPSSTAVPAEDKGSAGWVPFKGGAPRGRTKRGRGGFKSGSSGGGRKKSDPLKKFGG